MSVKEVVFSEDPIVEIEENILAPAKDLAGAELHKWQMYVSPLPSKARGAISPIRHGRL
jgi:hypothetical protein